LFIQDHGCGHLDNILNVNNPEFLYYPSFRNEPISKHKLNTPVYCM